MTDLRKTPTRLWHRLTAPHPAIQEVEQCRRARLLAVLLVVAIFNAILLGPLGLWLLEPSDYPIGGLALLAAVLFAAAYGLNRARYYAPAAVLTVGALCILNFVAIIIVQDAPILSALLIGGVLLSSLLLSGLATGFVGAAFFGG